MDFRNRKGKKIRRKTLAERKLTWKKLPTSRMRSHNLFKHRWSPRAFSERRVEPGTLRSLLEAARWAASCANEQPWNFIVATKDEPQEFEQMLSCLVEGNIGWAKNAPVLMISVARLNFENPGPQFAPPTTMWGNRWRTWRWRRWRKGCRSIRWRESWWIKCERCTGYLRDWIR